jgi:F420-non-reducing hydrogenase iron-sulfur subunit
VGTCHFLEGNLRAKKRVEYTKKLLDETGINGDRLEFFHIAASEAPMFAETVRTMTQRAKELGPNPLKKGPQTEDNAKKE